MEKKKIKIVYVITRFRSSGPINQTYYIIKHLNKEFFEATVVSLFPEQRESKMSMYNEIGVPIIQLGMSKVASMIRGSDVVYKVLNEIKPDIIQAVGIPPYRMTLKYSNVVHFVTLRNYCFEDYPIKYGWFKGWIMAHLDMSLIRNQLRKGEPFVTCSKSLSKIYQERENLTLGYIRNGVDVSQYMKRDVMTSASLRRKLGFPLEKKIFVYSGAISDRKNQEEAIRGFLESSVSKSSLMLLLGDGTDLKRLKEKYYNFSNVIFKGKVSNVSDYLTASDVYISTSKSEGLPNGVLEAMAVGLPVLLSDIPQHMEILNVCPKIGLSYTLGDIKSLSKQFENILKHNLYDMGNAAHDCVMNNFTSKEMSRKYQELYKSIVNNKLWDS